MNLKSFFKSVILSCGYYIWIILTLSVVTFMYDYRIALVEFALGALLLVCYLKLRIERSEDIAHYIRHLTDSSKFKAGDTLTEFKMPVVLLDADSTVVWRNNMFDKMVGGRHIVGLPLSDFIPGFNLELFDKQGGKLTKDIRFGDNHYHVFGNVVKADRLSDGSIISLYWEDRTDYHNILERYDREHTAVVTMIVDNYEDVMQDTPSADKPKLSAAIEEAISIFGRDNNAIISRYEKDRYIMCVEKQYVDKMIEGNFAILDTIREIYEGNKMAPTLSIGVGIGSDSLAGNELFSSSALDMALGRGGDQAIIKDSEEFHFYGGKTQETEKRTRVKARVIALAIRELIVNADSIIIMGHRNGDIDCLGAALGLYRAISNCGKQARILLESYNETVQRMLDRLGPDYSDVFIRKSFSDEIVSKNTLVFVVDTHKYSLVENENLLNVSEKIVVIDHHRRSTGFIDNAIVTYHEPYASSASELVTELIQYMDAHPNLHQFEAESLYAGIYMDTKNFTFKTGVRTFEAVSYLRRAGVNTTEIKKLFSLDYEKVFKKIAIMETASIHEKEFLISTCKKNDDDMLTIVAQAADDLLNITGIKCAFVICDMGDYISISGRSYGEINVQLILETLGGGGHLTIAGAQIKNKSIDQVYDDLVAAIDEYRENL